jgi:hypothetical protein
LVLEQFEEIDDERYITGTWRFTPNDIARYPLGCMSMLGGS